MAQKAPGKHYRKGMSLAEFMDRFGTEEAAHDWFVEQRWGKDGRHCPRCGSVETSVSARQFTFWCPSCKQRFSVRTGTLMEESRLSLRKWAIAIYMHMTNLKGVSSMKLHRDIGVTQKTAWFMLQRIRKAFDNDDEPPFGGPIEVDEAYMGGLRENMPKAKRKTLKGRGAVGKTVVAGAKDRATNRISAEVVARPDKRTLHRFITERAAPGAKVYTDDYVIYRDLPFDHEAVRHVDGEYVRGDAHTQGIESFWSTLKRAHKGIYHKISPKHLHRYVVDFAGRHNIREADTADQMGALARGMVGKRLRYAELIAA